MAATIHLAGVEQADELLSSNPLALLIGMVLDQQVPLEWAFRSPLELQERLGGLDAGAMAAMDPERLVEIFCARPALHRFPAANARRVQSLCRLVRDEHHGDAAAVWTEATDGADLLRRIRSLPGFGEQKARIFIALLGKQLEVRPDGWQEAAGRFGQAGTYLSVADIVDEVSLGRVRAYKAEMKAITIADRANRAAAPPPGGHGGDGVRHPPAP